MEYQFSTRPFFATKVTWRNPPDEETLCTKLYRTIKNILQYCIKCTFRSQLSQISSWYLSSSCSSGYRIIRYFCVSFSLSVLIFSDNWESIFLLNDCFSIYRRRLACIISLATYSYIQHPHKTMQPPWYSVIIFLRNFWNLTTSQCTI